MLISLGTRLAHLSRVVGAVRIALKRVEVQRSIPWTSIQHGLEGRVDNKHAAAEDLSQHLTCTVMKHAHGAMQRDSHAIEREKRPRVSNVKSLCTCEFAVSPALKAGSP